MVGRAVLAVVVALASRAHAQPAGLTQAFQDGVDAFRLGKYDEARAHLEKARDLDPTLPGPYRFLAAVAQAQRRWDDCIEQARKALEINPQSSEAPDTRRMHDDCRVAAGRASYGGELGDSAAIAVTTNVVGATVKINGLTYGATPLAPRPITAGTLEIEIDKPGWRSQKATANALAGIVTDLAVDLEPDPDALPDSGLGRSGASGLKVGWLVLPAAGRLAIDGVDVSPSAQGRFEVASGTRVVEVRQDGKDPWRRRVRVIAGQKMVLAPTFVDSAAREAIERRGFYLLGSGGALLVAGFAAAIVARSAANEVRDIVRFERARDASRPLAETAALAPVRTRADLADARDQAARWGLVSNVAYGAGLVTAGVGAYFLYQGARERSDAPPPYAIAPTRGGIYVAREVAW